MNGDSIANLNSHPALRLVKYLITRAITISITIVIGIFITVVIANKGGYIDAIVEEEISNQVFENWLSNQYYLSLTDEKREQELEKLRAGLSKEFGLTLAPFPKNLRYTLNVLTFQWGSVLNKQNIKLIKPRLRERSFLQFRVTNIVLKNFPNTILLIASANLLVFILGLPLALILSRNYSNWIDRLFVILSPISSIPSWAHGIFLIIIFAIQLKWLPISGMVDVMPPNSTWGYIAVVLKHMALPVSAIFISLFFQCVYTWRTFFLIYSSEDYVELAKAKGIPDQMIERRYILRPTLPFIVTSFSVTLLGFWQTTTALEYIFGWPGIGMLYVEALGVHVTEKRIIDAVLILGVVTIFAYLMGLTMLIMDATYALMDPRFNIGSDDKNARRKTARINKDWRRRFKRRDVPIFNKQEYIKPLPALNDSHPSDLSAQQIKIHRKERWQSGIQQIWRFPSVVIGAFMVLIMLGIAIYTVIVIPPAKAKESWHRIPSGIELVPKLAPPLWVNWFRKDDLPETVILTNPAISKAAALQPAAAPEKLPPYAHADYVKFFPFMSNDSKADQIFTPVLEEQEAIEPPSPKVVDTTEIFTLTYTIDYPYRVFPQDVAIYFFPRYDSKQPYVVMTWITPDGREFKLGNMAVSTGARTMFSTDIPTKYLFEGIRRTSIFDISEGEFPPICAVFFDPKSEKCTPLPGTYTLNIQVITFEPESTLTAKVVVMGQAYGIAGTDIQRRDLSTGLLWGFPIALAYGLIGATVSTLLSMLVAAAAVWFGGWVDTLTQRITEANMILPILAIGVLLFYFYGVNFWVILGIIVLLNVFGNNTKAYRAAFMQVKESPYIEAAQVYNASGWRIILHYLTPRIIPLLIPQLVALIPAYVFLEATLGLFGVGDPFIPTWGSIINSAMTGWAFRNAYYWIAEPIALLLITGLTFAMFGLALDRVLNPRLRDS